MKKPQILDYPNRAGYYWNRIIENDGTVQPWFCSEVTVNNGRYFWDEEVEISRNPVGYTVQFVWAEPPSFCD